MEVKRRSRSRSRGRSQKFSADMNRIEALFTSGLPFKNAISLFLMFACAIGFFSAFRFGAASLDYYSVRNSIQLWNEKQQVQTEEEFLKAKSSIANAKLIHFSHPLYADMTGQVIEWGVVAGFLEPKSLSDAKIAYLRATELRPSWPVTWGSLAVLKWRLNQFDDEMLTYLANADKFGPVKPEIHRLYVELGLSLYQANHPFFIQIRDKVKQRLVMGLDNRSSRPYIMDFINQTDSKKTVCRWIKSEEALLNKIGLNCN